MAQRGPRLFTLAASFQLVSGLVNAALLPMILFAAARVVGDMTDGAGSIIGLLACYVAPIGVLEVGVALLGFLSPHRFAHAMRWVTWAEFAAALGGAFHAAVVGFVVGNLLGSSEVRAYLRQDAEETG